MSELVLQLRYLLELFIFTLAVLAVGGLFGSTFFFSCRVTVRQFSRLLRKDVLLGCLVVLMAIAGIVTGFAKTNGTDRVDAPPSRVREPELIQAMDMFMDELDGSADADACVRFSDIRVADGFVEIAIAWTPGDFLEATVFELFTASDFGAGTWRLCSVQEAGAESGLVFHVLRTEDHAAFYRVVPFVDTDGDGISDAREALETGTDPLDFDSDDDDLPDGWEVDNGLLPNDSVDGARVDSDGDGIPNGLEMRLGTWPLELDTDGDGLEDGEEAGWIVYHDDMVALPDFWHMPKMNAVSYTGAEDMVARYVFTSPVLVGGESYASVSVSPKGLLLFHPEAVGDLVAVPQGGYELATCTVPSNVFVLAPYWADLTFGDTSEIRLYEMSAGFFVAEFRNMCLQHSTGGAVGEVSFMTLVQFTNVPLAQPMYGAQIIYGMLSGDETGALATVGYRLPNGKGYTSYCMGTANLLWSGLNMTLQIGWGTDPLRADTDGEGLSDAEERTIGTDPRQPDSDGDGMDDGWESRFGFDPLTRNDLTERTDDDATADPDEDGIPNGEECVLGTDPRGDEDSDGVPEGRDSDGDGVADNVEIAQGSDPADGSDGGIPGSRTRLNLYFGDHSGSHSEKYRVEIRPVKSSGVGEPPRLAARINQRYGACEVQPVFLKRGWRYEMCLEHIGTSPSYGGNPRPDYDYTLQVGDNPEVGNRPANVVIDDPKGLLGVDESSSRFGGKGKVVKLTVLAFHLEIQSDPLSNDDVVVPNTLLDSRSAKIKVRFLPSDFKLSTLALSLSCEPTESGTLVNDNHGTNVTLERQSTDQWAASKIYWYGVLPDKECHSNMNAYTFTLLRGGEVVNSVRCPVAFPTEHAFANWIPPSTNGTSVGPAYFVPEDDGGYWACSIQFSAFDKAEGDIRVQTRSGVKPFTWTGQYAEQIQAEELFHLRQLKGEASFSEGGFRDCFTVQGIQYFIRKNEEENPTVGATVNYDNWTVRSATREGALTNAARIIRNAVSAEIAQSNIILQMESNQAFMELKAKTHVGYNAAWRYHCTYESLWGPNPVRRYHPAYASNEERN